MENVAGEQRLALNALLSINIFHTNLLILLKLQTVKSHSFMMGASNLAIVIFSTFSISGI